jgi:competence protein ComEC
MIANRVPVWKNAPFIRLLIPLVIGIILQWQFQFPIGVSWYVFSISIILLFTDFLLPRFTKFKWNALSGIAIGFIFLSLGSLLTWYKDIRHNPSWFGNYYSENNFISARLTESPVEKTNSYKTAAIITSVNDEIKKNLTTGDLIIYFKNDSSIVGLDEGSQIIFSKPLQEIKNAGNPGGFNYKRYSIFQGITHQVFLKPDEFVVLNEKNKNLLSGILNLIRKKTLKTIRKNIPGEKESGLAEALLIGYKDDLDQNLVQSYTNTGVVHIIAISGMHLALIYWLLSQICRPLKNLRKLKWIFPLLVISGLWIFSLVAGAQASVVRSAVMFTCIVLGETLSKKTSIYNTLAVSAFILLCYNPFWLWDVGFQLSYAAVLSIVIFMKPIYNLFYIKNKTLDFIWKLNAVSLAAQLLTTPLSIYHFHQFPNFFLLTNFVAVPLSSIIVLGEIFLSAISFIPFLASIIGKVLSWLIWLMNSYIERIEGLPYSLWDGLQINILQTIFLILAVAGFGYWFLEKKRAGVWLGLASFLFFSGLRSFSFYQSDHQQKLIVYNVPNHQAIDLLNGRNYFFVGDSDLVANEFVRNFHIKPSRILHRVEPTDQLNDFTRQGNFLQWRQKHILLINDDMSVEPLTTQADIDLLVISKNPKLYLSTLFKTYNVRQVVFDGSAPAWKIKYWEKDCDSCHIPYFNVSEKGAFVMNLD